jgi:RNA polymerase sigma-70 factor (ECF subfamily)
MPVPPPSPPTRSERRGAGDLVRRLLQHNRRDVAAVEDALGEAFARALGTWPRTGVPQNPDGWLLVAARNRLRDRSRGVRVHADAVASLLLTGPDEAMEEAPPIPDTRLELMFVCAHPAIDAAIHAPLMLQVVLGLGAAEIASSFLVSPDTMGRRLGRAKMRIRDAGLSFTLPDRDDLPARLSSVMEAVYAAYGQGWDSIASDDAARRGLAEEAVWLARLLAALAPGQAEVRGLLALMLFCETRAAARRVDGRYVPFAEQDLDRWNRPMLAEAEDMLRAAGSLGAPGRFQIEAAIQSAMVQSRLTGDDMRGPLLALHGALAGFAPTIGNRVGLAAALAELEGPAAGLAELARLPAGKTAGYQPYWALSAHLLEAAGAPAEDIRKARTQAIGLASDPAVRAYLSRRQCTP